MLPDGMHRDSFSLSAETYRANGEWFSSLFIINF